MTSQDLPRVDLASTLLKRWRTILLLTLLGGAAAAAYSLLAPAWYEAHLTVVPAQRSRDAIAMGLAEKLPAAALDTFSTDVRRIEAVLSSGSVTDEVIDKFKLQERYGNSYREQTRAAVWEHCFTSVDRKSGVVSLSCEDKDPKQAQAMVAYFGEVGNRVFGRVSASSAHEERQFLEAQVTKARVDVDAASSKLRDFQEKHKIVDLPEQSKAVISAMASIKGELLSKQLELSYLSSFSSSSESSVSQLQRQVGILQAKLDQLEAVQQVPAPSTAARAGSAGSADAGSFFPDAMSVPELRYELEQLMREQKTQETVFALLTQRFEMARVDEARDTSTFQILDYPTLPTMKSRPKRRKIVFLGLLAGGAAALLWILLPVYWQRRSRATPANA